MISVISGARVQGVFQGIRKNLWKLAFLALLLTGLTIGSALLVEAFMPDLTGLRQYGYVGAFAAGFFVNATLMLPPILMGATLPPMVELANHSNFLFVAAAYAAGATLGESIGYGVGMGSKRLLRFLGFLGQRNQGGSLAAPWVEGLLQGKKSWFWVVGLTILPFPPFDVAGIIAGGLRYPFLKFFTACLVGRTGKYLFLFSAGGLVWNWLVQLWHTLS